MEPVEDESKLENIKYVDDERFKKKARLLTRDVACLRSRDVCLQVNIKELLIYCVYLIFLSIAILGKISSARFYFSDALSSVFVRRQFSMGETTLNFQDISTKAEFIKFAETTMLDGFYWDFWYSEQDQVKPTAESEKNVLYENRMVGRPQLRQVRVRNNSCRVPEIYGRRFPTCYDYYRPSTEDRNPFSTGSPAYTYKSADELLSGSYIGLISWYGGGGFSQVLPANREKAVEIIKELKNGLWIDRGTRAVFIDFTVYNPNIDMFCITKLIVEFPPQGAAIPSWSIQPVKVIAFREWLDYLILISDIILFLMVLWFVYYTLENYLYFGWSQLTKFWTWFDLIIMILIITYLSLSAYFYSAVRLSFMKLVTTEGVYVGFDDLAMLNVIFHGIQAALLFFSWFGILKYLEIARSISRLQATISACALDLIGFILIFLIALWAFSQLAYALFSHKLKEFRTWDTAAFTLIRVLLGNYGYREISAIGQVLGPLFFLIFIFIMYFILLSMLLAIINNAYGTTRYDGYLGGPKADFREILQRGWFLLRNCCRIKSTPTQDYQRSKLGLTSKEIQNILINHNFSQAEINEFLQKFEIRSDVVVTQSMLKDMLIKLNEEPTAAAYTDLPDVPILRREYNLLQKRFADLEESIERLYEKLSSYTK